MHAFGSYFILILFIAYLNNTSIKEGVIEYKYIIPSRTQEQLNKRIENIKETLPDTPVRQQLINEIISDNEPIVFKTNIVFQNNRGFYTNKTMSNYPLKMGEVSCFFDVDKEEYIAQSYIFNKPFVVSKEGLSLEWTFTNEQKVVSVFTVKKAIAKKEGVLFAEVWYTNELPAFPIEGLGGLKGGVVEAHFANGNKLLIQSFDTNTSNDFNIEVPSKGKKISEEEFNLLYEKKIKKANEQAKNNLKN